MPWMLFALLTPLFWSITNIFDKMLVDKYLKSPMLTMVLTSLLGFVLLIPVTLLLGLDIPGHGHFTLYVVSIIIWLGGIFLYFKAMNEGEASRVITAFNALPLFVLILAIAILGETITVFQILGVFFLSFGAVVVSLKKSKEGFFRKWIIFVIASAVLFAIDTIITKHLISFYSWFSLLFLKMAIGAVILLILSPLYFQRMKKAVREKPRSLALGAMSEGFSLAARGSLYFAFTLGPVGLVYSITSIQPFFVLVFAILCTKIIPRLFKEEIDVEHVSIKLIAVILAVAGAAMVSL